MNHLHRKALALVLGALVALAVAPGVFASVNQFGTSSCSIYMVTNTICLKEDTGGGGDEILVVQGAGQTVGNLGAIGVTVGDNKCNGGVFNNGSWNDCVSWVAYNIAAGEQICLFQNASFGGTVLWSQNGPASGSTSLGGSANDNASSISIESTSGGFC